jgi:hypothetical protein
MNPILLILSFVAEDLPDRFEDLPRVCKVDRRQSD